MNLKVRNCFIFLSILFFLACNNDKKTESPYDDILGRQPFLSLTDSIESQPGNDELWFRRAVLLNKNNFREPALADFRKAWSMKKDERYAYGISNILLEKRPDSAILFMEQALKDLPESFLLQLTLARAYDASGQTEQAMKIADLILSGNPEQVDVLKLKADLLDKKGESTEAIRLLERAYAITPYDIDLNYALAYKYAENRNAKVIALCDSLVRLDSLNAHAEPHYYKGIYYTNIGDRQRAVELFNLAIRNNYNYLNAYIEKARALYEMKKYADALKTVELANRISPKFPDAWYWMAKCQEVMGDKENAKINYQKALGLDPDFIEAKEALDKLGK